jgi:hypothetical protein
LVIGSHVVPAAITQVDARTGSKFTTGAGFGSNLPQEGIWQRLRISLGDPEKPWRASSLHPGRWYTESGKRITGFS